MALSLWLPGAVQPLPSRPLELCTSGGVPTMMAFSDRALALMAPLGQSSIHCRLAYMLPKSSLGTTICAFWPPTARCTALVRMALEAQGGVTHMRFLWNALIQKCIHSRIFLCMRYHSSFWLLSTVSFVSEFCSSLQIIKPSVKTTRYCSEADDPVWVLVWYLLLLLLRILLLTNPGCPARRPACKGLDMRIRFHLRFGYGRYGLVHVSTGSVSRMA